MSSKLFLKVTSWEAHHLVIPYFAQFLTTLFNYQGFCNNSVTRTAKSLLATVMWVLPILLLSSYPSPESHMLLQVIFVCFHRFVPTITTWTGNYRTMRAYIPKHQSMQLKNTAQVIRFIQKNVIEVLLVICFSYPFLNFTEAILTVIVIGQIQHIGGLPKDWEERVDKVHKLISKAPHYNKVIIKI